MQNCCCLHNNPIAFICRNQKCVRTGQYLVCQMECMDDHFEHPKDLLNFSIFHTQMLKFHRKHKSAQINMGTKIRQTMNRLLHLKRSVNKYIDTQIEAIKKLLTTPRQLPDIQQCIYIIKQVNIMEETVIFESNELQKQVSEDIRRSMNRLYRKINSLMNKNIEIKQCDDPTSKVSDSFMKIGNLVMNQKKSYEFKIDGSIYKISNLLKTVPEHIDRLKIYLNQDTYDMDEYLGLGIYMVIFQRVYIELMFSLRIYKESYQKLIDEVAELKWLKKVHVVVWDNFLKKQGKLNLLASIRHLNPNLTQFMVEDKLMGEIHSIV